MNSGSSVRPLGVTRARECFEQALGLVQSARAIPFVLDALAGLAAIAVSEGRFERALELALPVLRHPASSQETKDQAERLRSEVEVQLTSHQIEAARAWAQAKTSEAIVTEILGKS